MKTGFAVSGGGHALLIGWMLVAPVFMSPPPLPPLELPEVTLISASELGGFAASAPEPVDTPAPLSPPPEPEPAPAPEPTEDPATAPTPPEAPIAPVPDTPLPPAPPPAPAPIVAPTPSPTPSETADEAEVAQDATTPDPGETPREAAEETAPPEAATEIVTEAEERDVAPNTSVRPVARPERPTETAETPAPAAEPGEAPDLSSVFEQAASDAPAALGPPLTGAERDALRVSVQRCWNIGALSSEASRITVTLGVDMTRDGRPIVESIRLVGSSGGAQSAVNQAFETARRAVIRCGATGYDLPEEKYDQWQRIEMTFNPDEMRLR